MFDLDIDYLLLAVVVVSIGAIVLLVVFRKEISGKIQGIWRGFVTFISRSFRRSTPKTTTATSPEPLDASLPPTQSWLSQLAVFWFYLLMLAGVLLFAGIGLVVALSVNKLPVVLFSTAFLALLGSAYFLMYAMVDRKGWIFTSVKNAKARIILFSGKFVKTIWVYNDHVELSDGTILDKKHLYHPSASIPKDKVLEEARKRLTRPGVVPTDEQIKAEALRIHQLRDTPLADDVLRVGKEVAYFYHRTKRSGRKGNFKVVKRWTEDVEGKSEAGKQIRLKKEEEVQVGASQVFLDKGFNFMDREADDLSIVKIDELIASKTYPSDFYHRVDRGFYVKLADGDTFKINYDDAVVGVIDQHWQKAEIVAINHSSRRLFGGNFLVGFPYFHQLLTYHQTWSSLRGDGEPKDEDQKNLRDILLNDDIYVVRVRGAEDVNLVPLDLVVLVKLRIVHPEHAMFNTEKVLENVVSMVSAMYRQLISSYTYDEAIKEKTELDQSWWKIFQIRVCDPVSGGFWPRYGIWIKSAELLSIEPSGTPQEKARLKEIQTKVWLAKKEAEAAREKAKGIKDAAVTDAEGRAEAVRIFFSSIKAFGNQGLQMQFLETLKVLGEKEGKMVIPFGNLLSFLDGVVKPSPDDAISKLLNDSQFLERLFAKVEEKISAKEGDKS